MFSLLQQKIFHGNLSTMLSKRPEEKFREKKDLNCLISSLFLILSKNYSDFSCETSTRFVRSAFRMSRWTFWKKKQLFFPWNAFLRFSGVLRGELWKFWLRISGRFFKTKIHLHRVSFWREKFPWKQKLFYRSRTPRERFGKMGKKFSRGSSKLHAGCPGQVFEEKETFCEKLLFSINTGFWAKYSHSWPIFFEGCRNFNLSVMRNVLRKKTLFWREKSVF